MIAVVTWIVIGASAALLEGRLSSVPFPGGPAGESMAGAAGGFLGGGLFAVVAHRGTATLGVVGVVAAAVFAVLLATAIRTAHHAEPR